MSPLHTEAVFASIPSPSANGLHVGPLFIHAYGLAYVVGIVAAVALTIRLWQARGGDRKLVEEVALCYLMPVMM